MRQTSNQLSSPLHEKKKKEEKMFMVNSQHIYLYVADMLMGNIKLASWTMAFSEALLFEDWRTGLSRSIVETQL